MTDKSKRGIDWIYNNIWFEVRVEPVEIYIFNQLVLSFATYTNLRT